MGHVKKAIAALVGSVLMLLVYFGVLNFGEAEVAELAKSVTVVIVAIGTVFGVWKARNTAVVALWCVLGVGLLLTACTQHATYIKAGDNATGQLEAGMTGGRIILTGPFELCREPVLHDVKNGQEEISDSVCVGIMGDSTRRMP